MGFRVKYSNVESWSRDCIPLPLVKCFSCGRGYISNLRCDLQAFEESKNTQLQSHAYLPIQYKECLLQKTSAYLSSKTSVFVKKNHLKNGRLWVLNWKEGEWLRVKVSKNCGIQDVRKWRQREWMGGKLSPTSAKNGVFALKR